MIDNDNSVKSKQSRFKIENITEKGAQMFIPTEMSSSVLLSIFNAMECIEKVIKLNEIYVEKFEQDKDEVKRAFAEFKKTEILELYEYHNVLDEMYDSLDKGLSLDRLRE